MSLVHTVFFTSILTQLFIYKFMIISIFKYLMLFVIIFFFYFFVFVFCFFFFFSSRRRHTRLTCDWSSDVCSSDLPFFAVAVRRDRASRVPADGFRPPEPAPAGSGQDRRAAAGGGAPARERHRRLGLRAPRGRRMPRESRCRTSSRPLRLERARRSLRAGIRGLTGVNCCYCGSS